MNKFFVAPILEDEQLSMSDVMVFNAVCQFAKWKTDSLGNFEFKADNMFPSHETIAERAHCSVRTVKRSLKHLEELGYINILHGIGNTNRYSIDLKITGVKLSKKVGKIVKKMGHNDPGDRPQSPTNNKYNNRNNKNINRGGEPQNLSEEELEARKLLAIEQLKELSAKFSAKAKVNPAQVMYGTTDLEKLTKLDR